MVQFLLAVRSLGVLYKRYQDAIRGRRDGHRTRRRLLCGCLSLIPGNGSWAGQRTCFESRLSLRESSVAANLSRSERRQSRISKHVLCLLLALILADASPAPAQQQQQQQQQPRPPQRFRVLDGDADRPTAAAPPELTAEQARASVQWLADLMLNTAPRTYDGDKNWGEQKKLWAGVKIRREGFKLKTHRRFREVNQGRWIRYEATLVDRGPGGGTAAVARVHQVHLRPDSVTGQPRWQIDSSITAPMTFTAQIQRWNLGVKLFSVTIRGTFTVRLDSTASVDFVTDYSVLPPALVFDPRIDQANLVLERFEVDRVSRIGGDVAEEWGELMEDVIRDRFLKRQNEQLVSKLNRAIDKERDHLRVSTLEWLSGE